jgi:hypothetical protein
MMKQREGFSPFIARKVSLFNLFHAWKTKNDTVFSSRNEATRIRIHPKDISSKRSLPVSPAYRESCLFLCSNSSSLLDIASLLRVPCERHSFLSHDKTMDNVFFLIFGLSFPSRVLLFTFWVTCSFYWLLSFIVLDSQSGASCEREMRNISDVISLCHLISCESGNNSGMEEFLGFVGHPFSWLQILSFMSTILLFSPWRFGRQVGAKMKGRVNGISCCEIHVICRVAWAIIERVALLW